MLYFLKNSYRIRAFLNYNFITNIIGESIKIFVNVQVQSYVGLFKAKVLLILFSKYQL